ncbi:hypothetical protein [Paenibacillus sp. Marseille-Q4541]|uniref:hypothetical protein n=1 Tax=Paenibacillus sp. Marseille-Q4541 TaxID=2831522 RepID=UPI001BAB6B99|nr:hypothetical protein [Paenibacillus sp. Marseille-Q4541]
MAMNMRGLLGRGVKINRGGPDAIEGTLMDVRWDHMVVHCKEGLVYVNESHIKSITDTGRSGGARGFMQDPIRSNNFLGVMRSLRYQRVQINRGGPEKLEGILADADQNQLVMTLKNQEIVRIPLYHVKSISVLGKDQKNNNTSQGNKENSNQSQGNQSKGNQSKSNQSKGK